MRMRIRNVCTYGLHHIYIYTVRLIIEHPREWLASLADYAHLGEVWLLLAETNTHAA